LQLDGIAGYDGIERLTNDLHNTGPGVRFGLRVDHGPSRQYGQPVPRPVVGPNVPRALGRTSREPRSVSPRPPKERSSHGVGEGGQSKRAPRVVRPHRLPGGGRDGEVVPDGTLSACACILGRTGDVTALAASVRLLYLVRLGVRPEKKGPCRIEPSSDCHW